MKIWLSRHSILAGGKIFWYPVGLPPLRNDYRSGAAGATIVLPSPRQERAFGNRMFLVGDRQVLAHGAGSGRDELVKTPFQWCVASGWSHPLALSLHQIVDAGGQIHPMLGYQALDLDHWPLRFGFV